MTSGQESVKALPARHYPQNRGQVEKRTTVKDTPMGPKDPPSTVLIKAGAAVIVAFRKHTLLLLDDCLYALQPSLRQLPRSSLHRGLQRHGIRRLPACESCKQRKKKFRFDTIRTREG